jgi:hypothetical protein
MAARAASAAHDPATTASGGNRSASNATAPATATAALAGDVIPEVATGVTSAAPRIPTTTALIPRTAAASCGRDRAAPRMGSAARTSSAPGTNRATVPISAPATPPGPEVETAPRYAPNENRGPGIAWANP